MLNVIKLLNYVKNTIRKTKIYKFNFNNQDRVSIKFKNNFNHISNSLQHNYNNGNSMQPN